MMTNQQGIEVRTSGTVEPTGNGEGAVERASARHVYTPPTDIVESSSEYLLTLDVPGARQDSLEVTFENDVLTIRAHVDAREYEGYTLVHAEYESGDYQRAFEISEKVNADAIEASLKHGVLTIRLPKAKPSRRKVAVSTS